MVLWNIGKKYFFTDIFLKRDSSSQVKLVMYYEIPGRETR